MPGPARVGGGGGGLFDGPTPIGVSMRPEVLVHKRRDGRKSAGRYCFWELPHWPKDVRVGRGSRLWVASAGRWRGYFVLHGLILEEGPQSETTAATELRFHSESWHESDRGPRHPFRGFTYEVPA